MLHSLHTFGPKSRGFGLSLWKLGRDGKASDRKSRGCVERKNGECDSGQYTHTRLKKEKESKRRKRNVKKKMKIQRRMSKQDKGKSGLADNERKASPERKAERIDRGIEILANGNGTIIDKNRLILSSGTSLLFRVYGYYVYFLTRNVS